MNDMDAQIDSGTAETQEDSPEISSSELTDASTAIEEIAATVEALLFSNDAPLSQAKLATIAELPSRSVKRAIEHLNDRYEQSGTTFRIANIAGGFQMQTLPEYHEVLKRMLHIKKTGRLSQAAMETLSIVAYRQPMLRADIEAIRGVACGEVLRSLMERQLVKIVGRAEVIGRPMLYGTSKHFLEIFGLAKIDDLPQADELRNAYNAPTPPPVQEVDNSDEATEDDILEEDTTVPAEESDQDDVIEDEFEEDEFDEDDELDQDDDDEIEDNDEEKP